MNKKKIILIVTALLVTTISAISIIWFLPCSKVCNPMLCKKGGGYVRNESGSKEWRNFCYSENETIQCGGKDRICNPIFCEEVPFENETENGFREWGVSCLPKEEH